jgi:hypothetical protein
VETLDGKITERLFEKKAGAWREEHFGGMTLRDIGKRERLSEGYVGQCIFRRF